MAESAGRSEDALIGDEPGCGADTLCQLVRDAHRALNRVMQGQLGRFGVNLGQWVFLRALWQEDGITQRELSQRVGMMEPTTVTALNGMERLGLVERVRNKSDRRKINVFLTVKAQALRDLVVPGVQEVNSAAVCGLSESELVAAISALRTMIANLSGSTGSVALET